jgi:carbohydrate-binding DOMON domain-containing protein
VGSAVVDGSVAGTDVVGGAVGSAVVAGDVVDVADESSARPQAAITSIEMARTARPVRGDGRMRSV